MKRRENLIGMRYGRLTVTSLVGARRCICRCDCGTEKSVDRGNLKSGCSQSCGCLRKEVARKEKTKHGHTVGRLMTKEYRAWKDMKNRCINPRVDSYKHYGARGITVCERWLNSFENFIADMGKAPQGHVLDRKDNNHGYSPENCRWVTPVKSSQNRRCCVPVEFNGKKMPLSQFCREMGLPYGVISLRIRRGWTVDSALSTPPKRQHKYRLQS